MKKHTGHAIPSHAIVHLSDNVHVYNDSYGNAYLEVTSDGEIQVKPIPFGRIIIGYTEPEDSTLGSARE